MPRYPQLRLRKVTESGAAYVQWAALDDDGQQVALICRVGEPGRDHYPWDWYFTVDVPGAHSVTGVAESRRDALDTLSANYAQRTV